MKHLFSNKAKPMPSLFHIISLVVAIVAVVLRYMPRATFPDHLKGHQVYVEDELLTKELRGQLMDQVRTLKTFMSNVDQAKATGFVPTHEHIGEAIPLSAEDEGKCQHPYMLPSSDRSKCILVDRIDVGKHFLMTGGLDGIKETYSELMDRVGSFSRFIFFNNLDEYPVMKSLFESDKFQTAAKSVCPKDKTYLDPFQFSFIFSVPGQTVAAHLDAPYFWGANRRRFPQWLLISMVFSNLFQERFINQIQVVAYLHEWAQDEHGVPIDPKGGGDFVYYANSTSIGTVVAKPGAATIVDGSKVLHAAKIFHPEVKAPHIEKDKVAELIYMKDDLWGLTEDGTLKYTYRTSDLRISMVYRARCFADAAEAERYATLSTDEMLTLEQILEAFRKDLIARKVASEDKLNSMKTLDFALLIMDTYIQYPLPALEQTWMPYNYCMLPRVMPWTNNFLKYVC
jgi:hypothetical protein